MQGVRTKWQVRVLHISATDFEGGAGRAANRIHAGLRSIGVESAMFVRKRFTNDPTVFGPKSRRDKFAVQLRTAVNELPVKLHNVNTLWSLAWVPHRIDNIVNAYRPEIVHFHWICDGFVPAWVASSLDKPIVWTLHDCWPFTGGCHYTQGCTSYEHMCGRCPQLDSRFTYDLSRLGALLKRFCWTKINLAPVAPSTWLAESARKSALFAGLKIRVVPNGLDTATFKPIDKQFARQILNFPNDAKLILFGATDPRDHRKGLEQLKAAIRCLWHRCPGCNLGFVVFGTATPIIDPGPGSFSAAIGRLYDDHSLALLYSAADVTCVPSLEDNLPQTAVESIACGTPVVAFATGGLTDIVDHLVNGYLARPFESCDLAAGIGYVLSDDLRWRRLSEAGRKKAVEVFDSKRVSCRYLDLYRSLCDSKPTASTVQ
jgi:glycosyltransferase involved in cell wall biosynthesis